MDNNLWSNLTEQGIVTIFIKSSWIGIATSNKDEGHFPYTLLLPCMGIIEGLSPDQLSPFQRQDIQFRTSRGGNLATYRVLVS